jgi:GT2 family glycosyltransferase/glycosyltransferase involved in cell wall biosynthesis
MIGVPAVSIVIPVVNKLAFTRQCLDRIARCASDKNPAEVIVVDNGSTDGTERFFHDRSDQEGWIRYQRNPTNLGFARGNNIGARLSTAKYLLFLNNDTIVQPGWLDEMVALAENDPRVGIVGIKQLFPYTNLIHHTGIVFGADRMPTHIYPHADASLPHVNKQREYQAVNGACLLIPRGLFGECGMFDEAFLNGYEDIDLCLTVRQRGRSVVCCTKSFIYHYGQISETRTDHDDANAARFKGKWNAQIQPDAMAYHQQDHPDTERKKTASARAATRAAPQDLLYFADDLSTGSALTWASAELVLALDALKAPVALKKVALPRSLERDKRSTLEKLMVAEQPVGGIQIRWSHYWPQHLGLELSGRLNLELFVINYLFGRPATQPWDYWLQCLAQNHYLKLPLSSFCRDVLLQVGVPGDQCHVLSPGYSPEIDHVGPPSRRSSVFKLLTVTNSHDLERYGTTRLLEAYWRAFSARDDVVLVLKDYGAASGDTTLRHLLAQHKDKAAVEYLTEFTSKEKLIELYKSCDAFVSAHRGEGYGMKILDALACGLPVVTPLFGGPTDFCTPSNCLPVDFTLTPVGDCLDTRALRITNAPMWAEPDLESLTTQLRRVVEDRDLARQVGERARQDVVERFTWRSAAQQFLQFVEPVDGAAEQRTAKPAANESSEPSVPTHWLGRRISVVVPTFNRQDSLLKCLRALERQSILSQEFEVIVIDDASTDGTAEMLSSCPVSFELKYFKQVKGGPGTARNEGIRRAEGEIVLFIGDDIMADERLLEEHLLAHAQRHEPGTAILGHIDWEPGLQRSAVMDFVCGDSSLQFAYTHIPKLGSLDYRFFYTSNISLRRQFLVDAASDGVIFDPCFSFAAFEDSEFAFRLAKRGLEIHYCARALVYHEHWMDLDSFSRREYCAGRMAVVFYRKHPQLDEQLQVRWIGEWTDAVDQLLASPELDARLRTIDTETDKFLRSLAKSLEELISLQTALDTDLFGSKLTTGSLKSLLNDVFAVTFDVERTRGKVDEWYGTVGDPAAHDTAKRLLGCVRKLEFFASNPVEIKRLEGTLGWLTHDVVGNLRRQIGDLEHRVSGGRLKLHRIVRVARKADFLVQKKLNDHAMDRWLNQYLSVRGRLKRLLVPPRPSSH